MSQSYQGLEAEWHDLFWEAEEAANELPLIEEFLESIEGSSLYVGSGSGRLLGPLVLEGLEVSGLESSAEMVALSRKRWPEAKVVEGAWKDEEGEWSAILVPGFTFQLFENPRLELLRMASRVGKGGRAYLSLFFPWAELTGELPPVKWYSDREIELPDGQRGELWTKHVVIERKSLLKREHSYRLKGEDGKVIREEKTKQTIRFFVDAELERLFKKTGWKVSKEIFDFGEHDGDTVYVTTLFLERS